jgi:hypothetical protein
MRWLRGKEANTCTYLPPNETKRKSLYQIGRHRYYPMNQKYHHRAKRQSRFVVCVAQYCTQQLKVHFFQRLKEKQCCGSIFIESASGPGSSRFGESGTRVLVTKKLKSI